MANFILLDFLHEASQRGVNEICIVPGAPIHIRSRGRTVKAGEVLMPADTERIIREIYALAKRTMDDSLYERGDDNFSFTLPGVSRFRVSLFRQRNSFGCILRMIAFSLPSPEELHIPPEVMNAANLSDGLVLAAGYSGSGKTTTLASIIQQVNRTKAGGAVITLENPLEYLHSHGRCIVIQREIFKDTPDYVTGIEAAFYQRPDLLLISDMPTAQIVRQTIRAATSGRLILSTLYGDSSADAIEGLLTMFPPDEQPVVCGQLARVLRMVIFQRMVPCVEGGCMPIFESVEIDAALRELLRQNDMAGFQHAVACSKAAGVVPFDRSIVRAFRQQQITYDTAVAYAMDRAAVRRMIH